jgi:hypothetical protein
MLVKARFADWRAWRVIGLLLLCAATALPAMGQDPSPETAPTLFPGGALVSYNSVITTRGFGAVPQKLPNATARPTFAHEALLTFSWGVRRNLELTAELGVARHQFDVPGSSIRDGGTGLGDLMLLVKYRFYRRDSERGTTQASFAIGPKLPTGTTGLRDTTGARLPAGLQPGTGSTDVVLAGSWTYTGLFGIKRLVADDETSYQWRTEGAGRERLGSNLDSRLWFSYRPYQSRLVGKEWFIGPELRWMHQQKDQVAGVSRPGSSGDVLLAGATTYLSACPGTHLWIGVEFAAAQTGGSAFMRMRHRISFGITRQFRLHQ